MSRLTDVVIDLSTLFEHTTSSARLADLAAYEQRAREIAGRGRDVVLTGRAPVWLYLRVAHALHGIARTLRYRSGQGIEVPIFDHSA